MFPNRTSAAVPVMLGTHCALAQPADSNRAPTLAERAQALEAIRVYALNFIEGLPDFTCIQMTHWALTTSLVMDRSGFALSPTGSRSGDVQIQLAFVGRRELSKIVMVNGKPAATARGSELPAMQSRGEFGALLARIFAQNADPKSAAVFRWARIAQLNGRRMYVFAYRVPKESGYGLQESGRTTTVPFKGLIYADFETKAVMRIELECTDIPASAGYRSVRLSVNYKPARVAEQEFVLPSSFEEATVRTEGDNQTAERITAKYVDYRRFSAESAIQFGGARTQR